MIPFCKFHGFGNDYIVFEADELKNVSSIGEFSKRVCRRNTGIGGDGIAILEKLAGSETADYSCRIINPDGSEAGFSGNGTRCAVAYLYYKNLWREKSLKLKTKSGVKTYELLERIEQTFWFRAELGKPKFDLPESQGKALFEAAKTQENLYGLLLDKPAIGFNFFFVDVGNPVVCVFVREFNDFLDVSKQFGWQFIGQKIESLEELFPERTNVVFVKIIDRDNIEIRIWERGAGETSSSGTCSIAAAVASAFTGKTNRKVSVRAEGGTTEAVWRESDNEMMITGRADLAFCGEWNLLNG
ncbi:MAG: diaminopimelate epimerase [Acidobacteriota bacterium]|nr:diaminopimelate epimerase [Acidobacteriota bacterium]